MTSPKMNKYWQLEGLILACSAGILVTITILHLVKTYIVQLSIAHDQMRLNLGL